MTVRLPRLLSPAGGHDRLNPSFLSCDMQLWSLSTAQMTLPEGETFVTLGDLVELYGPSGSLGIFRVAATDERCGFGQDVDLEHTLSTLDNDITGSEQTFSGTLREILSGILACQLEPRWVLGDVESSATGLKLETDYTPLREAVMSAVKLASGLGLFFEQTDDHWLLHVRALPTSPTFECRASRNAGKVNVSLDMESLCNRVVDEALPGGSLAVDPGPWPRITRPLNLPPGTAEADALRYANDYLEEHRTPTLSIQVAAVDLAEMTGESLDRFTLGGMGRIALPDYGITQDEQLIAMEHTDLIASPQLVYLTLSKPLRQIEDVIVENARRSGGAGRAANQAKEGLAYAYIRIDEDKAQLDLLTGVTNQQDERISSAEIRLDGMEATIDLKAEKTIVDDLGKRVHSAEIAIDGANATITQTAQVLDAQGNRLSAAEIAIDGLNSQITLKADKIDLQGYVTMSKYEALEGTVNNMFSDFTSSGSISADHITAGTGDFDDLVFGTLAGSNCGWASRTVQSSIPDFLTTYITDSNGNKTRVVTGWATAPSSHRTTIRYLAQE